MVSKIKDDTFIMNKQIKILLLIIVKHKYLLWDISQNYKQQKKKKYKKTYNYFKKVIYVFLSFI